MSKEKRKPRNKAVKKITDPFTPIDFNVIGTDSDPCFGKLHSLNAPECKRCGDSEVCQMAMAMTLHKERENQEKTQPFMDLEEKKEDIHQRTYDINGVTEYIWKLFKKYCVEKAYRMDKLARKVELKYHVKAEEAILIIRNIANRDKKEENRLKMYSHKTRIKLIKP